MIDRSLYNEKQYLETLKEIYTFGAKREDRTGVGTQALFGLQMKFNLEYSFPLLTTKEVWWRGIVEELFWFLRGGTNVESLQKNQVHIWDEWANEDGDLGPVYGKQWRAWPTYDGGEIDQLAEVITNIQENPTSRRHIVSAWNVAQLDEMQLVPCHMAFQFWVHDDRLSCKVQQRSADFFIGVPFNIASYALLTHMVAQQCRLKPGMLIWSGGDCHIYRNHETQVRELLDRDPRPAPELKLHEKPSIDDYHFRDCEIRGYDPHPKIQAPIAV